MAQTHLHDASPGIEVSVPAPVGLGDEGIVDHADSLLAGVAEIHVGCELAARSLVHGHEEPSVKLAYVQVRTARHRGHLRSGGGGDAAQLLRHRDELPVVVTVIVDVDESQVDRGQQWGEIGGVQANQR